MPAENAGLEEARRVRRRHLPSCIVKRFIFSLFSLHCIIATADSSVYHGKFWLLQDMENEIEVILGQFRVLAEQKEQIDNELRPLNVETRTLKDQINAFDERAQEANVRVLPSVTLPPESALIFFGVQTERSHGCS